MTRSCKYDDRRWNLSPTGASCATCLHFAPDRPQDAWPDGDCRIAHPTQGEPRWPQVRSRYDWCSCWTVDPTGRPLPDWTNKNHGEIAEEFNRGR